MAVLLGLIVVPVDRRARAAEAPLSASDAGAEFGVDSVQARLRALREDRELSEEQRAPLVGLYQLTLDLLHEQAQSTAQAQKYEAAVRDIPTQLDRLRAETTAPAPEPTALPSSASLPQLEQRLAQLEGDLAVARGRLNDFEREPQERTDRRIEIARQLSEVKQPLQDAARLADTPAAAGTTTAVLEARRALRRARQRAVETQVQALSAELRFYESGAALLSAELSQAAQRVARLTELVRATRQEIRERRSQSAMQAVIRSEQEQRTALELARDHSVVRELAGTNLALVRVRTGPDGLTNRIESTEHQLTTTKQALVELEGSFDRICKRVAALEKTGVRIDDALGRYLRQKLQKLPPLATHRALSRRLRQEVGEALGQIAELRDRRAGLNDLDPLTEALVQSARRQAPAPPAPLRQAIRGLLEAQRGYLDEVTADYDSYLQQLVELEVTERRFVRVAELLSAFVNERAFWIRSSPRWSVAESARRREMFLRYWPLTGVLEIPNLVAEGLVQQPVLGLAGLVSFALLVGLSRRMRVRSNALAEEARKGTSISFGITLEAMVYAVLLAVRGPLLLFLPGWWLSQARHTTEESFIRSLGASLLAVGTGLFVLEFYRQICRAKGLAESHFRWDPHSNRIGRRHLTWFIPVVLPLGFIINVIERQGYEAAVGQPLFILTMVATAVFAHFILHPRRGIRLGQKPTVTSRPVTTPRLVGYLLGLGVPVLLGAAAYSGYYFSALELSVRARESLWTVLLVFFVRALVLRWLVVTRRRLAIDAARKQKANEAAKASVEGTDQPAVVEAELDLSAINLQTRNLIKTAVAISLIVSIAGIWSSVFPAFKALDRIELWPVPRAATTAAPKSLLSRNPALHRALDAAEPTPANAPQPVDLAGRYITLADLLLACVVLVVTITATRNLPGFLELTLLNRLQLKEGVEYAVVTLVRYTVFLAGVVWASKLLGLDWSQIQWIVAAFSLGLAFGLQEIFANFISGLIILFERPIRLGDIVTVGEVAGTVTRINIRATTVLDWDRREYLIPNKEFITGKVLNWTLSDAVTRVTVPVGIAYGSDTALAERLLVEAATENPGVLSDPAPRAVFTGFADSALDFRLYVFIPRRSVYMDMLHRLTTTIDRKFRQAGINIAFPQRDLHVSTDRPIAVQVVPRTQAGPMRPGGGEPAPPPP